MRRRPTIFLRAKSRKHAGAWRSYAKIVCSFVWSWCPSNVRRHRTQDAGESLSTPMSVSHPRAAEHNSNFRSEGERCIVGREARGGGRAQSGALVCGGVGSSERDDLRRVPIFFKEFKIVNDTTLHFATIGFGTLRGGVAAAACAGGATARGAGRVRGRFASPRASADVHAWAQVDA